MFAWLALQLHTAYHVTDHICQYSVLMMNYPDTIEFTRLTSKILHLQIEDNIFAWRSAIGHSTQHLKVCWKTWVWDERKCKIILATPQNNGKC